MSTEQLQEFTSKYDIEIPDSGLESVTRFRNLALVQYDGEDDKTYQLIVLQAVIDNIQRESSRFFRGVRLEVSSQQPRVAVEVLSGNRASAPISRESLGEWLLYGGQDYFSGGLWRGYPPMLVQPAWLSPQGCEQWHSLARVRANLRKTSRH